MRTPVHEELPEAEQLPAPTLKRFTPRKLAEPDPAFVRDLITCIKSGARVETSALYLGCTKKTWKRWRQRTGGIYDDMRRAIAEAQAHSEIDLQLKLARKSPGAALKELQRQRTRSDAEPEPKSRRYDATGHHTLQKAMPHLLQRISDDTTTDLTVVEQAAKEWRESLIADAGGRGTLTASKLALITATTGSWIILQTIDAYLFKLAATEGLVSKRLRKAWPIVDTRRALAESFAKQLQMIGLERSKAPLSLEDAIHAAKAQHPNGTGEE